MTSDSVFPTRKQNCR